MAAVVAVCWGWTGGAGATCGDYVVYGPSGRGHAGERSAGSSVVWLMGGDRHMGVVPGGPTGPSEGPGCGSLPDEHGVPRTTLGAPGPSVRAALAPEGLEIGKGERGGRWGAAPDRSGEFVVVAAPDRPPGA